MHHPSLLYLLAAGSATAALQRLVPNAGAVSHAALFGRQADECTSHSTCAECYGKGYVVCDTIGCFNPDKFQQCCKDASLCVGKTNKCCSDWGGAGVTGKAGVPNVTARPLPTATDTVSYTCSRSDKGEECCQRAPTPLHWCSGEFPYFACYNSKNQFCCTDGTVCDEEGCCDLFSAKVTNPWSTASTKAATSTVGTGTTGPVTPAASSTGGGVSAATGTPSNVASSSSTAGASIGKDGGLVAMGVAGFGLGMALV
ncbi:hypothetical protein C8A05DRAFT_19026 [Staphylotrichum tortipilum]|uniref:Uncharacterized protein n=1 Tax=Staphylotrichum tortipilum TaxID=2831512 RepID=A0AAN6MDW7_9PEZI|nr:hypothetical protein C8A05DRAFT_19026 [Staphylotrichum longicolle]